MAQTLPRTILKPTVHELRLKAVGSSNHCLPGTPPYCFSSFHSKQERVTVKRVALWKRLQAHPRACPALLSCTPWSSRSAQGGEGTCLPCLPALGAPCLGWEGQQTRTSVDESGNRHREVLSEP